MWVTNHAFTHHFWTYYIFVYNKVYVHYSYIYARFTNVIHMRPIHEFYLIEK